MTDLTDDAVDRLAAMLGIDLGGLEEPEATPEQIARVTRAGHRIGDGHRPFPTDCEHGTHRLEAL